MILKDPVRVEYRPRKLVVASIAQTVLFVDNAATSVGRLSTICLHDSGTKIR